MAPFIPSKLSREDILAESIVDLPVALLFFGVDGSDRRFPLLPPMPAMPAPAPGNKESSILDRELSWRVFVGVRRPLVFGVTGEMREAPAATAPGLIMLMR